MITVIIATRNRKHKLSSCLISLNRSALLEPIRIIIIDQSDNNETQKLINRIKKNHQNISYIKQNCIGKSKALNEGIILSKSNIVAFTDDDCIVSKDWIHEINIAFRKHPDVSCITGNIYPYKNISRKKCPPSIIKKDMGFTEPEHHEHIGFGNNFAVKKSALLSIGLFKTWLGPGSIGSNCEDGELFLRLLINKHKILHSSKMIIYHNKELNAPELHKQMISYATGEAACYGYFTFFGYGFARKILMKLFDNSYDEFKKLAKSQLIGNHILLTDWIAAIQLLLAKIRGIFVGLIFYIKETIIKIDPCVLLHNQIHNH